MNFITPKSGDIYFIPPGTNHGPGPNVTLPEVQQNSNITYKLFDCNRVSADGSPSEHHPAKALDVLDFSARKGYRFEPIVFNGAKSADRYPCARRHFVACEITIEGLIELSSKVSCMWLFTYISGDGRILP